jgi:hypothetical protein
MKLPIKAEYFDDIKKGLKVFEYRDAHITFISEATGEEMSRKIRRCNVFSRNIIPPWYPPEMFSDDEVVVFELVQP